MASFKIPVAALLLTLVSCKETKPDAQVESPKQVEMPASCTPVPEQPAPAVKPAPDPAPAPVAARTSGFDLVVIDPGHGGNDEGTAWYHVREKDVALAVAIRLEKLLRQNGIPCVLTRSTDTYVAIDERVKIANQHRHSLLVSIHFNASSDANASGFSSYYFSRSPSGKFVAQVVQEAVEEVRAAPSRGISAENYAVLVRTNGCAVLFECGFLSNKAEALQCASAEGQQRLAQALALGIVRAKPVVIVDPPETEIAKCEVYAKRLEEKEHERRKATATPKPVRK